MGNFRLTSTSYVVLGLIALGGRATPYDLKRRVAQSVANVWSFPHAQLYTEPVRLARAGLLEERREKGGRNRRHFTITPSGRAAVKKWLSEPSAESLEIRDPGLLRLFFANLLSGAELQTLARGQESSHHRRLAALKSAADLFDPTTKRKASFGPLRMGLLYERAAIKFWQEISSGT